MFKLLNRLFCEHYFVLDIFKEYNSVSDEANKIESALIVLKCRYCGYEYKIIDRQKRYIDWLREGGNKDAKGD